MEEVPISMSIGPTDTIIDPFQTDASRCVVVPGSMVQCVADAGLPLLDSPRECAFLDDSSSQGCSWISSLRLGFGIMIWLSLEMVGQWLKERNLGIPSLL